MIRLGVFGGRRGETVIAWCKKTGLAKVISVCEKDAFVVKSLKEKYADGSIRFFDDFEDFLNCEEMDAVILANYAHQHAPFAIRCLNAGKHVLSEVLPCQTLAEAVSLTEAVEKSQKIYAYAENYCYFPSTKEMRKLYREGKLGELEYAEGEYVHNCEPIWPEITYGERGHWRNNMYATFYCTHSIGPVLHITGLRPVSVTGFELPFTDRCARMGKRGGVAGIEMITLENGAVLRSLHGDLAKGSVRYVLYGSKGRMENACEDACKNNVMRLYTNFDEEEGIFVNNVKTYIPEDEHSRTAHGFGHGDSDYYVMYNFIRAAEGKKADVIDVYEALDMFLPGLFAYFSVLEGGTPQKIPDLRREADRECYRSDTRCTDPAIAGNMLLPSYSKYKLDVPDAVYDRIRNLYLNTKEGNNE